jgi:hypothetical protein
LESVPGNRDPSLDDRDGSSSTGGSYDADLFRRQRTKVSGFTMTNVSLQATRLVTKAARRLDLTFETSVVDAVAS